MTKLTTTSVFDTLSHVVFTPTELRNGIPGDAVRISGVVADFAFNRDRLEDVRDDVVDLLNELPTAFHEVAGCDMFEAANDRDGRSWTTTGEQIIDCLFALGSAFGMVQFNFDRQYTGGYALRARVDVAANVLPQLLN